MATPRLGLVVEDKPTELSCTSIHYRFHLATCIHVISLYWNTVACSSTL